MVTPEDDVSQSDEAATKSETINGTTDDGALPDSLDDKETTDTNEAAASGNSDEGDADKTTKDVNAAPQASLEATSVPPTVEPTTSTGTQDSPSKEVKSSSPSKATFVHDPNKITLRFLFAGRDGINVIIDCKPNDTVGEVKGALMSVWPENMPECTGGDRIRLICMGKGILMPDSKTLKAAEVPVFKTHPTPINVSVRPEEKKEVLKHGGLGGGVSSRSVAAGDFTGTAAANGNGSSGCCCVIC